MARRRDHLCVSAYLRVCGPTKSHTKTRNNHLTPSENNDQHLKKRVLAGSNAYLRICVFSKEITA
jgi:hypothetical protein